MRILLDQCVPEPLRHELTLAGTIETARFAGLSHLSNGALLTAMAGRFDVLITVDGSLHHQQMMTGRPVSVLLVRAPSNAIDHLRPLVPAILNAITTIQPGQVVEV